MRGKAQRIGAVVVGLMLTASLDVAGGSGTARAEHGTDSGELVWVTEGNRLRRFDPDTLGSGLLEDVLIPAVEDDPVAGRDSNGQHCMLADGSGRFIIAEDSHQPHPRAGWGLFTAAGEQIGKLTATYHTKEPEPYGCAIDGNGLLFTTEVGDPATRTGQLIMWFPPYDHFPGPPGAYPDTDEHSTNFCILDQRLGTAGEVEIDAAGRVYVATSSGSVVYRYSPPFPSGPDAAHGCGDVDSLGSPKADSIDRQVFTRGDLFRGMLTFSGIAFSAHGTVYLSSVATGHVAEYDMRGRFIRHIVKPTTLLFPSTYGNPQGIDVAADGTLYYADLHLWWGDGFPGPGPNGRLWRVRFGADGRPRRPEIVRAGLAFPDAVTVQAGNLQAVVPDPPRALSAWPHYGGGSERSFHNGSDEWLDAESVGRMRVKWRRRTGRIVTAQPSVAVVDVPGEGPTQVVYVPSWDWKVYALRLRDGSSLWEFETARQPGAPLPAASSADITEVDGRRVVFVATGETMYALDAITGEQIWRFEAGTGCRDAIGDPPGLCGFGNGDSPRNERNEIESSPLVVGGRVYFGMDVNDRDVGKGGFFALDARDGTLEWFLDLQTGMSCHPFESDTIRNFDGYHSEAELGLPASFFETRPGCDFGAVVESAGAGNRSGCENVWSSAAWDADRRLMYFGVSNCDTDDDPATNKLPPPMPPYDEALVAVDAEGNIGWHWRPREVDNLDLAFGAVPNLFTIQDGEEETDVVGIGNKDGTYYVLDRDGVNERNGRVAGTPETAATFPYWATRLVAGGTIGGIIASSSADVAARRLYVGTAAGEDPLRPQQPTMHALDMDTGEILWESRSSAFFLRDWTVAPTTGVNDVAFFGSATTATLRGMRSADGAALFVRPLAPGISAIASPPVVVDGTLVVGTGIGSLSGEPGNLSDITAARPSHIVALCVPGSPDCPDDRGVGLKLGGARYAAVDENVLGELKVESGVLGPRLRVDGIFEHNGDRVAIDVECIMVCNGSLHVGGTRIPIRFSALRQQGEMPDTARFAGSWTDTSTLPWRTYTYDVTVRES